MKFMEIGTNMLEIEGLNTRKVVKKPLRYDRNSSGRFSEKGDSMRGLEILDVRY
jgi:hypothetical protein